MVRARIANSNRISRNIFRHYTSSTDDTVIANGYPGTNDAACSDPAIIPNFHRIRIHISSGIRIDWMTNSSDGYSRTKQNIFSDGDFRIFNKITVKINIITPAKFDVRSIAKVKWRLDPPKS